MFDYEPQSGYVVFPRSFEKLPYDIRMIMKYLLYKATYMKRDSRSLEIGQIDTTIDQLVDHVDGLQISTKQMRNRINKMINMELISYKPGSRGIPSIITITGYEVHQNTKNYGKLSGNNEETIGELKGNNQVNDINNLAETGEAIGKSKGNKEEVKEEPIQNIKHKTSKNTIHEQIKTLWNSKVEKTNISGFRSLKAFKSQIDARLEEVPEIEVWEGAIDAMLTDRWWHGENDRGWTGKFRTFLIPEKFDRFVTAYHDKKNFAPQQRTITHSGEKLSPGQELIKHDRVSQPKSKREAEEL